MRVLLCWTLLGLFPAKLLFPAAPPDIAATVFQVRPVSKRIQYDQKPGALRVGEQLWNGDRLLLQLSGQVKLVLADGSVLKVEGGSDLTLGQTDDGKGTLLGLAKGLIRVVAEKQLGSGLFVRTDAAVAGVKGTQFQVEAQDGRSELKVLEGSVQFTPISGTAGALVQAGEALVSYPDRVDQVRKLNFEEVKALRGAFRDLVKKKQSEYAKRVRDAKGKRTKPEGKP